MTAFLGIALDMLFGYIMGIIVALFAIGNGGVHTFGYLKLREKKKMKGTLAAGFCSGMLLAILGIVVLILLSLYLSKM